MGCLRLAIVLLALGAVSAHEFTLAHLKNALFEKAMALARLGQTISYTKVDETSHQHDHRHHKHWHEKMRKNMEEARQCHEKCGLFVMACRDIPAIKTCYATCKDAKCNNCHGFEVAWMNKKLAKHPEQFIKNAEAKCRFLEDPTFHGHHGGGDDHREHAVDSDQSHHHGHHDKSHSDDHHHHYHNKDWHDHGRHNDDSQDGHHQDRNHNEHKDWLQLAQGLWREKMQARACHRNCGADVTCHSMCSKPADPFVRVCRDFLAIKVCRATCEDTECARCPKFKDRMDEKLSAACPIIQKTHYCHQACIPDDHTCHDKCHTFHGQFEYLGQHHGKDLEEHDPTTAYGYEDRDGNSGEGDGSHSYYGDGDGKGDGSPKSDRNSDGDGYGKADGSGDQDGHEEDGPGDEDSDGDVGYGGDHGNEDEGYAGEDGDEEDTEQDHQHTVLV